MDLAHYDPAPSATLAERALAAYEASQLEAAADAMRQADTIAERMVAAAADAIAQLFGPDTLERLDVTEIDGRPATVATVAGVRLVAQDRYPKTLRGLVACPVCGKPDRRTAAIIDNLEDLGRFLAVPATHRLLAHPHGSNVCDGLESVPGPGPTWQALYAGNGLAVEARCNELKGYDVTVIAGSDGGWLVVGHRRDSDADPDF
jgi:hypothetical protein